MIGLIISSNRPVYYQPSFESNFNSLSNISNLNQTQIDSWCLSNKANASNKPLCNTIYDLYHKRILIYVAIGLLLMLTKLLVKKAILFFRPLMRFKDQV